MKTNPRRYWIGGSTVPAIMGVSPYTTPLLAYQQIIGEAPEDSPEQLSFFRRRKSFEPVAAEIFRERTGLQVVRRNRRYTDPAHRFLRAEIDLETADDGNVEIKTVHPLAARDWGRGDLDDPNAPDDAAPVYVVAQAQHGLAVTGRRFAHVMAMIGFDDARIYRVERDEVVIEAMRAEALRFWMQHVKPRLPPPPVNASDLRRLFERDSGKVIDASDDIDVQATVDRLREAKDAERELRKVIERETESLQMLMQDASAIRVGRGEVITWRAHQRRDLDRSALETAHPAIVEQFKRAQSVRVFRVK